MAKTSRKAKSVPAGKREAKISPGIAFPPALRANGRTFLLAALIIAAVFWEYAPTLSGGWIWDDGWYLGQVQLWQSLHGLGKFWFAPGQWVEYYPIEETVLWTEWHLFGNDTFGYHLVTVLLHCTSALLIWRLFSKLGLRWAWLGGLLFAIHPVQVESVAYIAELKNTLSLPPFLLAMGAWIDFQERRAWKDYLAALGLFLVAMLCKITMAPFPVVLLLYAWWKEGRVTGKDLALSAPFFAISLGLGELTMRTGDWYQKINHLHAAPLGLGLWSRVALSGESLAFYLSKCFFPVELMPVYPRWDVGSPSPWAFLPWVAFAGMLYWFWRKRRSWGRHALLGFGFFLLNLAPFLGFKEISYMDFSWVMDHFLYIPLIGIIGLVVAAAGDLDRRRSQVAHAVSWAIIALIAIWMIAAGRSYAAVFGSERTLWSYSLETNPRAWLAYNNLGLALKQAGQLPEAIADFQQALIYKPDDALARNNLGNAFLAAGQPDAAIEQYREALKVNPLYAEALNDLGNALLQEGREAQAIDVYKLALQIAPNFALAHNNLGKIYMREGRMAEALQHYQAAVAINPDFADAHFDLGNAYQQAGDLDQAEAEYASALRINPQFAEAYNNLGSLYVRMGRIPEAQAQFEAALRVNPNYTDAQNNLAKVKAWQQKIIIDR